MKIAFLKHPYIVNLTWKSCRFESPEKTLGSFVFRSQNMSFVIGAEVDIWVIEGMSVAPAFSCDKRDPIGIAKLYAAHKAVPWSSVPFDEYDIVISWDPIVNDKIILTHPKILWVYNEPSHRSGRAQGAASPIGGKPLGAYDLFWDDFMRPTTELHELPQSVSFPYFAHPTILRNLVGPKNDAAVWIEHRHIAYKQPKERVEMSIEFPQICGLPIRFAPVDGVLKEIATTLRSAIADKRMLRCKNYLDLLGSCKYSLAWRKKETGGQAAIEAAQLGLIVLASESGIYHQMMCHPYCIVPRGGPPRIGLRKIAKIEADEALQREILAHQDEMLLEKFWKPGFAILEHALETKRGKV